MIRFATRNDNTKPIAICTGLEDKVLELVNVCDSGLGRCVEHNDDSTHDA